MFHIPQRYNGIAILLHWLLAFAIVATFCVGMYMTGLAMSPNRLKLFNWHKWAGMCILILSAVRLLWRLTHRPPPLPRTMTGPQRIGAHLGHALLYILFFAVPLAGWAYSSAAGFPIVLFGALPLPDWVPKDRELAALLKPLHHWFAYGLAAVVIGHVFAAFKHQFIDRDHLLARMGLGRGE